MILNDLKVDTRLLNQRAGDDVTSAETTGAREATQQNEHARV